MTKLGRAMMTAQTGQADECVPSQGEDKRERATKASFVKPLAFKSLVGKGHPEFSSGRQQVSQSAVRERLKQRLSN